jgi:hypothetical protein
MYTGEKLYSSILWSLCDRWLNSIGSKHLELNKEEGLRWAWNKRMHNHWSGISGWCWCIWSPLGAVISMIAKSLVSSNWFTDIQVHNLPITSILQENHSNQNDIFCYLLNFSDTPASILHNLAPWSKTLSNSMPGRRQPCLKPLITILCSFAAFK